MSSLAGLLLDRGYLLTGSEQSDLSLIKQRNLLGFFEDEGIKIFYGHRAQNLSPTTEVVIRSSAISLDNPEVKEARKKGLLVIKRSQALGILMQSSFGIAVAGAGGKSTTTAMLGKILEEGGCDPTVYLGAAVPAWGMRNFKSGRGDYFVCEADEYDRSFLDLSFKLAIVTTLFWGDHADYYRDFKEEKMAFEEFIDLLPSGGNLILNADCTECLAFKIRDDIHLIPVGFSGKAAARIKVKIQTPAETKFSLEFDDKKYELVLTVPGVHSVYNASFALVASLTLGLKPVISIDTLHRYQNIVRRLELVGERKGVAVIDDYAHHPEQIRMTLKALRQKFPKRKVTCLFQPRQFRRTRLLFHDFIKVLSKFDQVLMVDISRGLGDSEKALHSVRAEDLVEVLNRRGTPSFYMGSLKEAVVKTPKFLRCGEVLLTMGTGHELNEAARMIYRRI